MVKKLGLVAGAIAVGFVGGATPAAAEPPSGGGQIFIQATTPCTNGTNLFEIAASENAAGAGAGAGLYTVPNTFPPGNCGFPFPADLNLSCVEVAGQDIYMSGTYSVRGGAGRPVTIHAVAGTSPQIGIDFPVEINGGGWRCGAAKVQMEAASGIVRLTPA